MIKKVLVALFVLVTLTANAQRKCSMETRALIEGQQSGVNGKVYRSMAERFGIEAADGAKGSAVVGVLIQVDNAGYDRRWLEANGAQVGAKAGDVVSVRMPLEKVALLEQCAWVVHYDVARPVYATMDRTRVDTRTDSVHNGLGIEQPFDGSGVLIGITDWGFDYTHPNINSNQERRVLRAWDHYRTKGPAPSGFTYGTELRGYDALKEAKGDTSGLYGYGTHGTHVAGIAAGRGLNGHYVGQAPKANLLLGSWFLDEAAWVDQVGWMYGVAKEEGKRLVVNSSWGMYSLGTMDGSSLLSRTINSYSDSGVVFVTSGGNNGDANFHIEHTFDTMDTLGSVATWYSGGVGQALIYWGEPGESFKVGFAMSRHGQTYYSPFYSTSDDIAYLDSILVMDGDTIRYDLSTESANPYNGRAHAILNVGKLSSCKLHMLATADSGTHLHVWNVCNVKNHAGNTGCDFENGGFFGHDNGNKYYGVGEPACADKCIAVAAHIADYWRNDTTYSIGGLTSFSSWGPCLSGQIKPEISAPGNSVVSSISSYNEGGNYEAVTQTFVNGRPYIWSSMSGTSMSSPAVSGIVALMLQANPRLSVDTIRAILFRTARNDERTGALHENDSISIRWGHGKADALRAVAAAYDKLDIVTAQGQPLPLSVWPNPARGRLHVTVWSERSTRVALYDMQGRLTRSLEINGDGELNTEGLAGGVYVLTATSEGRSATKKVVIQ
ncbi:MAG: S8 family peptidase [Bacteroidales bacterium]|nr:S8 family peptidase [Bacteroidales bacterium]